MAGRILTFLLMATLLIGWSPPTQLSSGPTSQFLTWTHSAQADWMAGERDRLDVRTLDALGTPYGLDRDPRGAIRLRSQPGAWSKHPASPVLDTGDEGTWDDAVVNEAKVVYDGAIYHMWFAGRKRGPPGLKMPIDLGYATSTDGVHWPKHDANPVLKRGPLGGYDENMITAPSVLYDGERFHMWFSAVDFRGDWSIDLATSPDGVHWVKHQENPLLKETHDDRWDAVYIAEPCVLFNGSVFEMWYNGASATTETLLGHATSPDGIHWIRLEDDRPVLDVGPGGAWDDFAVARAHVLFDGEQYKMWYEGHNGRTWRIGYATSSDGIHWERVTGNPIVDLGAEGAWDSAVVSEPYVLFDGQIYRLFHSGYDGDRYRVGLATAPAVYSEEGTYISPPIESSRPIEWGTLTCDLLLPKGTQVRFEVASSDDGEGWGKWTLAAAELVSGLNRVDLTALGLPRSRYLRYQVTLTTSDPAVSPLIREIVIAEAVPDFVISLSQDAISLETGRRAQVVVSLVPLRGFSAPVQLSVAGLPPAVSATWETGSLTPPGSALVLLEASRRAQSGVLPLTVTAKSGNTVHSLALSLVLVEPTPTATPMPTATPTTTPTPTPTGTPTPTPTPLPTPSPLPPAKPRELWWGVGLAGGSVLAIVGWAVLVLVTRRREAMGGEGEALRRRPQGRRWWRHWLWALFFSLLALWGLYQAWQYVEDRRQDWEAYRERVRPGVHVAGIEVGSTAVRPLATPDERGLIYVAGIDASGMTADEIRRAVEARVIAPYRRTIAVRYHDRVATLDTTGLGLQTNLDKIVAQAVAVGGDRDVREGFGEFLLRNPEPFDVHFPLTYTFDYDQLVPWVEELAAEIEMPSVEHSFDREALTFTRGRPGIHLDTEEALLRLKAAVPDLKVAEVELPVIYTPPRDWGDGEIDVAISRAIPDWSELPIPAASQQITLPFEHDRWIGSRASDPEFVANWQPTRTMTGYLFLPGRMGWTLDVQAMRQGIGDALDADAPLAVVRAFTDVAPAPLTLVDVDPLLLQIAGHFGGFTGFYVQDLTTGEEIRHNTYVTASGMSMIKVAIMVTAYRSVSRPFSAELQDAISQMIAHSINVKSNYTILQIGEGDFAKGLERVNETLQALGMHQTYIRSAYRTEEGPFYDPIPVPERPPAIVPPEERIDLWPDTAMQTSLSDQVILFEALYRGSQGAGRLLAAFPDLTPEDCQEMLDLLKTNPTRTFLGPGFPDDVPMAHKNGFGGGQYTDERMNVGIIWPPEGRPYLVGLYQWDRQDWIHWLRVWPQQIEFSTTLYNYFTMSQPLPALFQPD